MRLFAVLLLASISGCAGVNQLAALHQVEFRFDGITDPRVAGIHLSSLRSPDDVNPLDLGRLTLAIASKDVPLDLTVRIVGRNPETNKITAKLIGLDWWYLVDGRETVSGRITEGYQFPPGQPTEMPVLVTFNLVSFFGSDGKALLDTALALAGQRTSTHQVVMRLQPVIDTPYGHMKYPVPLELDLAQLAR
ncbi:MAG TPA: hypothetical protein VF363_10950 [Candidatus Eisenbacteria bacterium]